MPQANDSIQLAWCCYDRRMEKRQFSRIAKALCRSPAVRDPATGRARKMRRRLFGVEREPQDLARHPVAPHQGAGGRRPGRCPAGIEVHLPTAAPPGVESLPERTQENRPLEALFLHPMPGLPSSSIRQFDDYRNIEIKEGLNGKAERQSCSGDRRIEGHWRGDREEPGESEGASVVVNYSSSKEGADKVVNEIAKAGGKAVAVHADLANAEDATKLADATKKAIRQGGHPGEQRRRLRFPSAGIDR